MPSDPPVITYVIGDATRPQGGGEGLKIIVHCVNNVNLWGSGFVIAVSKRWKRPEKEYQRWADKHGKEGFKNLLGALQLVPVEPDIWVGNLIGQEGIRKSLEGEIPVRYEALASGFRHIAEYARKHPERNISVHSPRLGCGLAGGIWQKVEPLLLVELVSKGVPVTVYDLP